jgi:hypothetical protein
MAPSEKSSQKLNFIDAIRLTILKKKFKKFCNNCTRLFITVIMTMKIYLDIMVIIFRVVRCFFLFSF